MQREAPRQCIPLSVQVAKALADLHMLGAPPQTMLPGVWTLTVTALATASGVKVGSCLFSEKVPSIQANKSAACLRL